MSDAETVLRATLSTITKKTSHRGDEGKFQRFSRRRGNYYDLQVTIHAAKFVQAPRLSHCVRKARESHPECFAMMINILYNKSRRNFSQWTEFEGRQ